MTQLISKLTLVSVLFGSLFVFHRSNSRREHLTLLLFCAVLIAWLATE